MRKIQEEMERERKRKEAEERALKEAEMVSCFILLFCKLFDTFFYVGINFFCQLVILDHKQVIYFYWGKFTVYVMRVIAIILKS